MPATHTCSCIHAGMPDRLDAAAVFSHCFLRSMHFGPFLSPSHPFLYYFMVEFFVSLSLCSLSLRYLNPLPSSQHYSTYSIENIPLIFDKLVFISGPFRVFWLDFHSASFLSTYFFSFNFQSMIVWLFEIGICFFLLNIQMIWKYL